MPGPKLLLRAIVLAGPHLVIAAGLLFFSSHLLAQYENGAGIVRLALTPPIDYPFMLYPMCAALPLIVGLRSRSWPTIVGVQLALLIVAAFFAHRLREQAESLAVMFVPGWTAAIAHGTAWGSYLCGLASFAVGCQLKGSQRRGKNGAAQQLPTSPGAVGVRETEGNGPRQENDS